MTMWRRLKRGRRKKYGSGFDGSSFSSLAGRESLRRHTSSLKGISSQWNLIVVLANLRTLESKYSPERGPLSAGAIISLVIPLLIFIFLPKYLVKSLTAGAGE